MATAGDPKGKEVADEEDGKNKVSPAGEVTEKPKKKGFFGKSTKSESKSKAKEGIKDDNGREETSHTNIHA